MSNALLCFAFGMFGTWIAEMFFAHDAAMEAWPIVLQSVLLALIGAGVWRKSPTQTAPE